MFGWLKTLSARTIIDASIFAVLMAAFATYTIHERSIGAAKIKAADAKAIAAAIVHNGEVESRAQKLTADALAAYRKILATPPAADAPRLRCYASKARPVPGNAGSGSAPHAETDVPAAGSEIPDPGPPIDTLLRDADAQVRALQEYIETCQKVGLCRK